MDLTAIVLPSTPPFIPPNARAGGWVIEGEGDDVCWVWEEDMPSPHVEAVLAEGDAQIAALEADVRARRHTHGAPFSESLSIVALARAVRGQ